MSSDYGRDMAIDVTALDVEWAEQAELSMQYGRMWAEAQDAASKAEEHVKYMRSKLIRRASKDPETCLGKGLKATDTQLEAYYRTHKDYLAAKDDWLEKVNDLNLIAIAKNEIAFTRKSALENLVTLHGQGYFAGPNVPRDLKTQMRNRKAERSAANKEANSNMKPIRRRKNEDE